MKKFLGIMAVLFGFLSCNDGDVTVKSISFAEIENAASCGDLVYKINGTDAMIIKITNATTTAFINTVGVREIAITGTTKVIYRTYSATPSTDNFCGVPPAATPSLAEEWTAIGGTIQITTTAKKSTPNATTGATSIIGYNHNIILKNITFQKPVGTQSYDTFVFGNFTTSTTLAYPFSSSALSKCSTTKLYSQIDKEALLLDNLDPTLFANAVTTTPRVANLSNTTNKLRYLVYNGTLPTAYFCNTTTPTTPTLTESWEVDNTTTQATIEVTTTSVGSGTNVVYTHKIYLKKVNLKKDNISFYLGDSYYLGDITTP
ncbi:hypothetical protein [Flavobacterium branchiophilum]|uniref:Lipoprotein n=1 Tax=Flavobacterium branchiophilum TaxID=55197 RepID=A0A2H3K8V0_9FLAO|nr:hypothetical protein [Flavobacterium branchiophilum]PDS22197.1 hypothetical protein B0A77_14065 [Flavobacterium branchiophilum]